MRFEVTPTKTRRSVMPSSDWWAQAYPDQAAWYERAKQEHLERQIFDSTSGITQVKRGRPRKDQAGSRPGAQDLKGGAL